VQAEFGGCWNTASAGDIRYQSGQLVTRDVSGFHSPKRLSAGEQSGKWIDERDPNGKQLGSVWKH